MTDVQNLITLDATINRFLLNLKDTMERDFLNKYVKVSDYLGSENYILVNSIEVSAGEVTLIGPCIYISSLTNSLSSNGIITLRYADILDTKFEVISKNLFLVKAKESIDLFKQNLK